MTTKQFKKLQQIREKIQKHFPALANEKLNNVAYDVLSVFENIQEAKLKQNSVSSIFDGVEPNVVKINMAEVKEIRYDSYHISRMS